MGILDLGMDADADAELERAERERLARRAAAQAEAASARDSAGYGDAALSRALSGLQAAPEAATPPSAPQTFQRNEQPFSPAEQARIGGVEQRLQAGDRAGVEADTRALQGGPEGMARPAVPVAPSAPMAAPAVGAGRDPGMRAPAASLGAPASAPAAAPAATPTAAPSRPAAARPAITGPEFVDPDAEDDAPAASRGSASSLSSPIEAAKTERRNAESSQADAEIARWDARIQEVQREMSQARDQRTRAVLGNLLANLVLTASRVLTGTRGSSTIPMRQDAFDERARERLSDRSREWSATDDMILRAQELREGQREQATEADLRSRREHRESQTLDLQRIREERTARIADARLRLQEATSEQERREAMLELQRNDPESAESERARRRYVASAMARERALGPQGRSAIDLETEVRGLAATDIEAMEGELASMTVGTRTSRAGGGTGRPPGQRPGVAVVGDVRLGDLIETGRMTEEQAAQLRADLESSNPRVRAEAQRQLATLMPGQGETRDIMPGLSVDLDIPNSEATSLRRQFGDASASWSTLGRVRGLARQFGPSAVLNPEAIRRIETEMVPLRAMVARIQNTGVINPGERPLIDAVLPDPTSFSGQALGTFTAALDQWERQALAEMDARWLPYVREERADEVRRALRQRLAAGRSGGQPQQAAASTDGAQYRVTNREGRTITRTLTPEQLRTFRAGGFTIEEVR